MSASSSRTLRLVTLGCKVNQYETQFVKEALESAGYREAAEGERAELCVVNTCTVTGEGDAKSRQSIRRLHQAHPDAQILVMGCYATRSPDTLRQLPGVSHVVTDKTRLAEELEPYGVAALPAGITRFDGHQRAFVKVQDGCLLHCSYCIIPQVRPHLRSRPVEAIVEEVQTLAAGGYEEIVLTGIHLGHYGLDLSKGKPKAEWRKLWHLLERLAALPGSFRVRLSSLEAAEAREDLLRVMHGHPRVVPHLHLCLQSGSDRILRAMKRRYTARGYLERVRRIRAFLDEPALTTDVIVGFPGETQTDFEATCAVAREAGLVKIHVFSYSPRAGTPAAALADAVPASEKHRRREALLQIEADNAARFRQRLLGRKVEIMVEGEDPRRPGCSVGTSCRYVPVSVRGYTPAMVGKLLPVHLRTAEGDLLQGEPVNSDPSAARRELPQVTGER